MDLSYTLTHFLYPQSSNNHKAKLLHTSTLFLLSILLIVYQLILQTFPLVGVKVLGYSANIPPDEIVRLANIKRQEAGMSPLVENLTLSQAAKAKGEHMLAQDYWAHVAPDGTEPWKFFSDVGYEYRYAGENLARDFSDPNSAVEAWMASPSHRDNMLSGKYKEIGVAVVEGDLAGVDTTIIVQFFGARLVDTIPQVPVAEAGIQETLIPSPTSAPIAEVSATIIPSPSMVPIAQVTPTTIITRGELTESVGERASVYQILISPFSSTRNISIATTVLLFGVMLLDGFIVARKKIPRVGGRTFAHLAFLGMVLVILLIAKAGQIL